MTPIEKTSFVLFVTGGLLSSLILSSFFLGDLRMIDGMVPLAEMTWWESVLFVYVFIGIFLNIFVAARHAFANGSLGWGWANLLLWPLSFFYTWKIYLGSKRSRNAGT